jgi:hypothetical protein
MCAPGGYVTRFLGGSKVRVMTWHLKNPVPPKAWGFGGEAPAWNPSFNIDMHVDIHLNIDCQFGFSNLESTIIITCMFIVNLDSQLNIDVDMHMHIDCQSGLNNHNHMHVHMGL